MNAQQRVYDYTERIEPCRNFNILAIATVIDPLDGKEKLVLSNFAAGAVGNLILIDPESGDGESIRLPGDEGAWAVLDIGDGCLLIGTCSQHGYLHRLDLRTRRWSRPLQLAGESYIWQLARGSDGMIYGCTYPGCLLLRYDPDRHELRSAGRASAHPGNLYARHVNGDVPGWMIVTGGMEEHFAVAYHLETASFRPVASFPDRVVVASGDPGSFVLESGGRRYRYGIDDLGLVDISPAPTGRHPLGELELADGRRAGVRGQDYYIRRPEATAGGYRRIPTEAPSTLVHTLAVDEQGHVWGASAFGQTICRYDPRTGELWNSSAVCNGGGEVYGMVFAAGRLYLSAYAGGDHIVYDPLQPWAQHDNINPRTLRSVAPAMIRPTGKSVLGPDGGIWTGWSARYGVYGGGMSRIDPATLEVQAWYDLIPEQQVAGLAADDRYLYFITDGGASGLAPKEDAFHFVVLTTEGAIVYDHAFDKGVRPTAVLASGGIVYVCLDEGVHFFDRERLQFVGQSSLGTLCRCLIALDERTIGAFGDDRLLGIDREQRTVCTLAELPGQVETAAVAPDGDVYFAAGVKLYRLERDRVTAVDRRGER
ncbi:hypothetical protein PA598K_04657 [Paenibacillus sp. 598K]|uniref:hypothetical protein n=1 Tax=Paenibacillus sp. 598K TaxID=1117987 RepID=UPI000FFA0BB3|nr:hypothetical protein [Paenibacillus sp. 598K]GBF76206.1 hypothetical protein PA598K_04657 [Paenibacillus sp. 598K]